MSVNQAERAFRAWPVLTERAARAPWSITYGELGLALGIHHRAVRYVLSAIQDHCLNEKLPPLTIIVVNQSDGRPGTGFIAWDVDDLDAGLDKVRNYSWRLLDNPFAYASDGSTEDKLADELVRVPTRAADIYALIKVRGVAQSVFRKALILAYACRCALCGLTFEEALEGAHLIPWSQATPADRLLPCNGLLLCSTHHRLFDAGRLVLTDSGLVQVCDPSSRRAAYSAVDKSMTTHLHGTKAFLPENPTHRPRPDALQHHRKRVGWIA